MMEMQGVAVLNSILRPHLSLDPDGAARVQQGAIQPSRVVPEESKTDHNVLACGDPNSGRSVEGYKHTMILSPVSGQHRGECRVGQSSGCWFTLTGYPCTHVF